MAKINKELFFDKLTIKKSAIGNRQKSKEPKVKSQKVNKVNEISHEQGIV